jgi:hypothetical protein
MIDRCSGDEDRRRMRRSARVMRNETIAMRRANQRVLAAHEALVARLLDDLPVREPQRRATRRG